MKKELSLKTLIVFMRASQAVQDILISNMEKNGVNLTEFAVLELLYHKGDQPIQHIGRKILLASSSITYVVDKLEKKELAERKACSKDRRVTYTSITEKGKQFIEDIFPEHEQTIQGIFEDLTEEELETTMRLLKKIGKAEK